jgi:endonuclease-3
MQKNKYEHLFDEFMVQAEDHIKNFTPTLCDSMIAEYGKDPYIILISCLLSLRARDLVTVHVCRDLFSRVRTPQELLAVPVQDLEKIIYKTGFYRNKAQVLRDVSQAILDDHGGIVPNTQKQLLAMRGVGLKTANLVMGLAFDEPAICVDTHVHRLSNSLGLVRTSDADATEAALRQVIPRRHWIGWNRVLVLIGQNKCWEKRDGCGNAVACQTLKKQAQVIACFL